MIRIIEKQKLDILVFLQNIVNILGDIKRGLSQIDELPSVDDLFETRSRVDLEADFKSYRKALSDAHKKAVGDLEKNAEKKFIKEISLLVAAIQKSEIETERKILVDQFNFHVAEATNYLEGIQLHKDHLETAMTNLVKTYNTLADYVNDVINIVKKSPESGKLKALPKLK